MKRALALSALITTILTAGLLLADGPTGYLDVEAHYDDGKPMAAAIVLDGAGLKDKTGRPLTTPQVHLPVAPGHHILDLLGPEGQTSHIGFSVQEGKGTSLTLKPRPKT
jgi:hypothetical protein